MFCLNYLFITSLCFVLPSSVFGYRILGVFLYPSRSHEVLGTSLLTELADRGHTVTMISTFQKDSLPKNFTHVYVNATDIRKKHSKNLMSLNMNMWEHIVFSNSEMKSLISGLLEDPKLKEFLDVREQYDVAISVLFSEALLGISHRVNASTVSFQPHGGSSWDYLSGNPHPYAYVPSVFTSYTDEMTFWQRFRNTYTYILCAVNKHFFNIPMQRSLLKHYFPAAPPLEELVANVDLHLVNSHYLFQTPRSNLPNVIPIGGFHLQRAERLKTELLKHLDELKNGVILFGLGSHKKFGDLDMKTIEVLLSGFGKSQHNFIVQYEGPKLNNVPKNVRLISWVPQRAVLSNQNTKLFITHGGRSSIAEAVYFGVPMLGLTVAADDNGDFDGVLKNGFGIKLDLEGMTEEKFTAAIKEVVGNSVYKQAVMKESRLFRRQEANPLDKAVYWIEHVAKYNGAKRLKSCVASGIPMYQYLLLDVILVTVSILMVLVTALYLLCRWTYRFLMKKRQIQTVKHKSV